MSIWLDFGIPLERAMKNHPHYRNTLLSFTILAIVGFVFLWLQLPSKPYAAVLPVSHLKRLQPRELQPPSRLLPHEYWKHRQLHPEKYNQISCSNLPMLEDIHYAAASWQHLQVENGSVYIYGAYWDARFNEPLVRVLLYSDVTPLPKLACQLWYEDENAPITVPSTVIYGWRPEWNGPKDRVNEPYILTCRARRHPPAKQRPPSAVSVVREEYLCGMPTNILNVQGASLFDAPPSPLNTSSISVCLKWLHFQEDISAELVEWIEMIKAFGADKLFVFDIQLHPNTRRVLDHYTATGFADVTEFAQPPQLRSTFNAGDEDFHDYRRELLPLNDCLYRSIGRYQWMTPIDSDEIIVPLSYNTWQEVIARETKSHQGIDALAFSNYYYLDGAQRDLAAPPYMKILGHLWRSRLPNPSGYNVKSFHNTSTVVSMHNHYPLLCSGSSPNCLDSNVNETVARLQHYRSHCPNSKLDCPALHDTVRDDTTTRWKHVIKEVNRVLTTLGIRPKV